MMMPPHLIEEMKALSVDDFKKLEQLKKDENSVSQLIYSIKPLYSHFKKLAEKRGLSKRTAIREALYIWIHKEENGEELHRYACLSRDLQQVIAVVRSMLKSKSIEELQEKIEYILDNFT